MTPEHLIRLRAGWECHDPPDADESSRVALPLARRPIGGSGRVRLVRRFQAPPIDPTRESLWLRLGAVPGLLTVRLNGRERDPEERPLAKDSLLLPLDDARPAGNVLELLIETPLASAHPGAPEAAWGEVALVVRGVDVRAGPVA